MILGFRDRKSAVQSMNLESKSVMFMLIGCDGRNLR